ncbi:MAG TPA: hypothetical protein VFZ34_22735, partial [Blastocatellia bacterium]|nr:hypothetical protein [Blastocatellia bacterium]
MEPIQLLFTLEHDLWWTTHVVFPFWQAFKQGTDSRQDHEIQLPSEETIRIVFAPEGRDTAPLTESEIESIHWVIKNEASVVQSMLSSLFAQY